MNLTNASNPSSSSKQTQTGRKDCLIVGVYQSMHQMQDNRIASAKMVSECIKRENKREVFLFHFSASTIPLKAGRGIRCDSGRTGQ